jgi:uracil phosphoribosyltransferase
MYREKTIYLPQVIDKRDQMMLDRLNIVLGSVMAAIDSIQSRGVLDINICD